MNPLLTKVLPWALALLLGGGLFGAFVKYERDIGASRAELRAAQRDDSAHVAEARMWQGKATIDSSRAAKLEQDTLRLNQAARLATARYSALLAPLAASRRALDSLLALPHDSSSTGLVGATRAFEQHSDSTIKACSDALSSEQDALKACQAQGAAVKLQLLDTQGIVAALAKDKIGRAHV